jgi:ParB-like chromosome segregation protein Spo0J
VRQTIKYNQIRASIREVGIIEPPVVARSNGDGDNYLLLDGHLRIDILKAMGVNDVVCLVATEAEAFTYNRRVSRLATVQEHRMILTALRKGLPEEKLAKALNLRVSSIRQKYRLLDGICEEAAEILKDKHVPMMAFPELKRLKPARQVEAARLMVTMNTYTLAYAKSLVAATPEAQLADRGRKRRGRPPLTDEQVQLMRRESESLDREIKAIERSYGADNLALVVGAGFVGRLLSSAPVVRHLAQHHAEILSEFQKIADTEPRPN